MRYDSTVDHHGMASQLICSPSCRPAQPQVAIACQRSQSPVDAFSDSWHDKLLVDPLTRCSRSPSRGPSPGKSVRRSATRSARVAQADANLKLPLPTGQCTGDPSSRAALRLRQQSANVHGTLKGVWQFLLLFVQSSRFDHELPAHLL